MTNEELIKVAIANVELEGLEVSLELKKALLKEFPNQPTYNPLRSRGYLHNRVIIAMDHACVPVKERTSEFILQVSRVFQGKSYEFSAEQMVYFRKMNV